MEFVTLTKKEFDDFSNNYKDKCYLQSSNIAEFRKTQGWHTEYVGVKENKKVLAATLLLSKKRHIKKEFYTLRGPQLDYTNKKLLSFFITELKKHVKNNNGYFLRIDPYIEVKSLDKDGKETGIFDNSNIIKNLKDLGFIEVESKQMTDTVQAKFMYVIDLEDNLNDTMAEMDSKTRQMIRKNEKQGVVIRVGDKNDVELFEDIMNQTSQRRKFNDRGLTFYKNMYEALIKDNMISLVFAELDINLARENLKSEQKEIELARKDREEKRKLGKCNEKKAKQKEAEEEKALERISKKKAELAELEEKYGSKITLGGILYILYGDEVASLFGGCYEEFKEYQCFYTIHYEMIKYAIDHKYKRYNFYAINNTLDKNDSQYGIYQFKRGFGGHVIEFIGEFILPVDKPLYKSVKILSSIKSKLKK